MLSLGFGFSLAAALEPARSIVIDGASSMTAAVQPSSAEFANKFQIGVSVHNNGSKAAMSCLADKTCHIGMIPFDSLPKDRAPYQVLPFGISGVEVIVGKGTGVKALTTEQLTAIYSRKVKNWKELGGMDLVIEPLRRRESGGLHKQFVAAVKVDPSIKEVETVQAVLNIFKKSPGVITYVNSGTANTNDYDVVKLDGVEPTLENIRAGKYKFRIEYFVVMLKDMTSDNRIKALADHILKERPNYFTKIGLVLP